MDLIKFLKSLWTETIVPVQFRLLLGVVENMLLSPMREDTDISIVMSLLKSARFIGSM